MADEQPKALVVKELPKVEEPANLKTVVTKKRHIHVNTVQPPHNTFKMNPSHPSTKELVPKEVESEGKA